MGSVESNAYSGAEGALANAIKYTTNANVSLFPFHFPQSC
jgi:hypothetical protein